MWRGLIQEWNSWSFMISLHIRWFIWILLATHFKITSVDGSVFFTQFMHYSWGFLAYTSYPCATQVFIHIHQGCFAGTGAIVRLPQWQWSKPDGYGKISQCITTTKHSKAKTVCTFLGIYCSHAFPLSVWMCEYTNTHFTIGLCSVQLAFTFCWYTTREIHWIMLIVNTFYHDDVIKWKHFRRYWPFVWVFHRSRWIPHTTASDAELWCFILPAPE